MDNKNRNKKKFPKMIFANLVLIVGMLVALVNLFVALSLLLEEVWNISIPSPILILLWVMIIVIVLGTKLVIELGIKNLYLFHRWQTNEGGKDE